jgi:RND family efflux transporter MFP subunit
MDLQPLKIDRVSTTRRNGSRRRSGWIGRLVFVAVVVAGLWLFRKPILRTIDAWRLPRVHVVEAYESSALTSAAVSGTAANGYVVPRVRAALSADTPGRIVELNVQEGSVVHRGDVVARLYSDEYQAALSSAEAEIVSATAGAARMAAEVETARKAVEVQLARVTAAAARLAVVSSDVELAEREKRRISDLSKAGFASAQALDQATTALSRAEKLRDSEAAAHEAASAEAEQAEGALLASEAAANEASTRITVATAQRDQAAATLAKTAVRAPFDGVVVLKDAEVGEVVSPNALGANSRGSVATMVDFSTLEAQVELPETSISSVVIGAKALIFLDAFPEERYEGRVDRIWPTANRQKATIEVRVVFLEPGEKLRPEMGVRVVFSPPGEEPKSASPGAGVILLPAECIVREGDRTYAFVVERGTVRARDVTVGEQDNGRAAVRSGVAPGDKVVVAPPPDLADGDRVQVEE